MPKMHDAPYTSLSLSQPGTYSLQIHLYFKWAVCNSGFMMQFMYVGYIVAVSLYYIHMVYTHAHNTQHDALTTHTK